MSNPYYSPESHAFNTGVAVATQNINSAILFSHIFFWLKENKKRGINQHEGRTWMFDSIPGMAAHFPYLTEDQIRKALKALIDHGYLIKSHNPKDKWDKTNWYAVPDEDWLDIKKMFSKRQNCRIDAANLPDGCGNKTACNKDKDNNTYNNKDKSKEAEPPPLTFGKFVQLKKEEYESLCKEIGKEYVDHWIEKINSYLPNSKKRKKYDDYAAAIKSWHLSAESKGELPNFNNGKKDQPHPTPAPEECEQEHRDWFKSILDKIQRTDEAETIDVQHGYVMFGNYKSNNQSEKIYFKNKNFKDLIKHELRKRNYKI